MLRFPRWPALILALVVVALLAGVFGYYRARHRRVLYEVNERLEAIAQLSINQIREWRNARLGEAAVMATSRSYVRLAERWMREPPAAEDVDSVLFGFRALQQQYRFQDARFVDASGKAYFSLSHSAAPPHQETQRAMAEAFRIHRPVFSDLYDGSAYPRFDLIVPFFVVPSSLPSGAVVFQYRAERVLYPMIQFWPTQSQSGELSIFRRDGDSVVFLNELRHKPSTRPLTFRVPLSHREDLAVQAVLGARGPAHGEDYRGTRVLAVIKPVPDTPWMLTAKQDEEEVLSDLRREAGIIALALLLLIFSAATALTVLWQRHDRDYYYALFKAEHARQESDLRFKRTLDSMMEGCHIIDFDWRYLYHNPASIRHSGCTREALIGHTVMEAHPGIEHTNIFPAIQRCMTERTSQHIENALVRPDGTRKWFEISIQPIPEGAFVLTVDITERREAEERLRASEARHRALFEHMMQGACRLRQDGSAVDVNPAALNMFGLTREQFMQRAPSRALWNLMHEDGAPFAEQELPHIVARQTGETVAAVAGIDNAQNGSRVWMEINAIPEFQETSGAPGQILITLHDITDRIRSEAEHSRMASAIDQLKEIVLILGADRKVQYANPAFERVTGYRREEAIGKTLPANEVQDEAFYRTFWDTLEKGHSWKGRMTNYRKNGTVYKEDVTVSPVRDRAGAIVNYVYVTRDITEYLALHEEKEKLQQQFLQSQKMESIGRLAGGVAHDFNNMLSVISGHAQLALDRIPAADPLQEHLKEIDKATQHSADLTRQLLAFARKQTIAPKVLDLNEAVSGSLNMLQRLIGEDIDLAWMPGRNVWPVHIDPAQIHQILTNLAINARDAIDRHGKVVIQTKNALFDEDYCTAHPGYVPGAYAALVISDDGCGMSKEIREHLFEPFFTTKETGKGTGLGLATVYGIVRQNEGFINIYSEPGSGTTFKIYFPRHKGAHTAEPVAAKTEPPTGGTETILVVEDEPSVLKLARLLLERLGYSVLTAAGPTAALQLAEAYAGEIHLLLADVVMPEMTGQELAEQMTRMRPSIRRIYMSGHNAGVIAHRGVLQEGVDFIQKPFSAAELAARIRRALEKPLPAVN